MSDVHIINDQTIEQLKTLLFKESITEIKISMGSLEEDIVLNIWNNGQLSIKQKPFFIKGDKVRFRDSDFNWCYGLVYSLNNEGVECISIGEGICQTPQVVELFNWNEEFLVKELLK